MSEEIKAGDVVSLKTSTEKMTVESSEITLVKCVWFDENNDLQRQVFDKEGLKLVKG